jgi:hypothetical protein
VHVCAVQMSHPPRILQAAAAAAAADDASEASVVHQAKSVVAELVKPTIGLGGQQVGFGGKDGKDTKQNCPHCPHCATNRLRSSTLRVKMNGSDNGGGSDSDGGEKDWPISIDANVSGEYTLHPLFAFGACSMRRAPMFLWC